MTDPQPTEFVKYMGIKGAPVVALQGCISDKALPKGWVKQDLYEVPSEVNTPLNSLIYPGLWKPMVDTVFDLGDGEHGEVRPVGNGQLYMFLQPDEEAEGFWCFINSVAGAR